jgi:hypothetical protein
VASPQQAEGHYASLVKPIDALQAEAEKAQASSGSPRDRVQALSTLLEEIESLIALCDGEVQSADAQTPGGRKLLAFIQELHNRESDERSRGLAKLKTELSTLAGAVATYRNDARLQAEAGSPLSVEQSPPETGPNPPRVTDLGEEYPPYVKSESERQRWDTARAVADQIMGDAGPEQVWQMTRSLYQNPDIAD